MKTYLHICCGPCGTATVETLKSEGREVVGFFSNSNLDTRAEFRRRLSETKKLGIEIIVDDYDYDDWLKYINNHFQNSKLEIKNDPEGGERCRLCAEYRLKRLFEYVRTRQGAGATTLSISPYKNYPMISGVAKRLAKDYNVEYLDRDLSPLYQKSIQLSKSLNMYRQKYCGCEFSKNQNDQRKRSQSKNQI